MLKPSSKKESASGAAVGSAAQQIRELSGPFHKCTHVSAAPPLWVPGTGGRSAGHLLNSSVAPPLPLRSTSANFAEVLRRGNGGVMVRHGAASGNRPWAAGGGRVGGRAPSSNETLRREGGCQVIRSTRCLAEGNAAIGQTTHLGHRWQPARRWVHEYVKIIAERGTKCPVLGHHQPPFNPAHGSACTVAAGLR